MATLANVGDVASLSATGDERIFFALYGTYSSFSVVFEAGVDGTHLKPLAVRTLDNLVSCTGLQLTDNTLYCFVAEGLPAGNYVQVRCTAAGTGSVTAVVNSTGATGAGSNTIADGGDTCEGATTDAKVTGDNPGTVSAKLRGLSYLWSLVTDTVNSWLKVSLATQLDPTNDQVAPGARASGGASQFHLPASAASTNATNIKATAGTVYGIEAFNGAAYTVYLHLYDASANPPVPGTSTCVRTIAIPAASSGIVNGVVRSYPVGITFANGIGFTLTKGSADNDTTAIALNDVTLDIDWK